LKSWNTKDSIEIAGMLAVVFSLIFVGLEIRQNSTIASVEAHRAYTQLLSEGDSELASNNELLDSMAKVSGGADVNDIPPSENLRMVAYYRSTIFRWFGLFQAVQEGVLPESYLSLVNQRGIYNTDHFRRMWPFIKPLYGEDFVEYFESLDWNTES